MIEVAVTCEIEDPTLRRIDDELSLDTGLTETGFSPGVTRELVHSTLTMRILKLLLNNRTSGHATEIARKLNADQPSVYAHLRKLHDLRLVSRENSPLSCIVWYSLKPDRREDAKNLIWLYHAVVTENVGKLVQQLTEQYKRQLPRKEVIEHPFFRDICLYYGFTGGDALALFDQSRHLKPAGKESSNVHPEDNSVLLPRGITGNGLLDD